AQSIFAHKVKKALEEEVPQNMALTYQGLSTNVLLGRIALEEVALHIPKGTLTLNAKSLVASGLRYLPLIQRGDLELSSLELVDPKVVLRNTKRDSAATHTKKAGQKKIAIETLSIGNGQLQVYGEGSEGPNVTIDKIDIILDQISNRDSPWDNDLPLAFDGYQVRTGQGSCNLGPLEVLQWQQIGRAHV